MRVRSTRVVAGRLACCVLVAAVVMLAAPPAASAHAVLVSSSPAAGASLAATPGTVVLVYDEPLAPRLSRATVTDPTGRRFESGQSGVSGKTMRVRLTTNAPGVYRVEWKTVSRVDGHTITGTFRFGVGVAPGAAAASSTPGPTQGDVVVAVLRAIEYAVLLLACGLAVLRVLGRRLPVEDLRRPVVPVAAALLAAGVLVVGGEAVVAGSGFSGAAIADYLTNGLTGWARVVRVGVELALLCVAVAWRRLSLLLLAAVIGALAVAGHGADVEPAWQGMAVNAAHLAAAGVWAGGILALALVRMTGGWQSAGRGLLPRFSRIAPWAFGVSVGLGVVQAAELLGGVGQVLHTSYGLTLVAKAAAVAAMVPLSLLAWRRVRVSVRGEAVLALVVVAAAAALAAYPVVPKEASEEHEASAAGRTSSSFPRPGDLTMGGRAGSVMVGLTVHPARPGRNTVVAYLASPATERSAARIRAGGRWQALTFCGASCRTGTVTLRGGQRVALAVAGADGGTATFDLPPLPAPDGSALAAAAAASMNRLDSYQVAEVLSGIRSAYVYARPHRMWMRTWYGKDVQETLWIGSSLYRRASSSARWQPQPGDVTAPVPYFVWNAFSPFVDARVVGSASVAGTGVTVVSLFGGHGSDPEPVWFTLDIDRKTGRVLRSQMWAPNHFMDDRYFAFDRPVALPSPDRP